MGEAFVDVIDSFLTETPSYLEALRQAAIDDAATTLEPLAHTLQGSSSNFGALRLADLCHELVVQCRAGTLDEALEKVERIATEYDHIQAALTAMCQMQDCLTQ